SDEAAVATMLVGHRDLARELRPALKKYPVAVLTSGAARELWRRVSMHPGVVLDGDGGLAVHDPLNVEADRSGRSRRNRADSDLDVAVHRYAIVRLPDLLELDAELRGDE